MIKVYTPYDVNNSTFFPVNGLREGEIVLNELDYNSVMFYNLPACDSIRSINDSHELWAKTCFTNQRLILQYKVHNENSYQVLIDFEAIKKVEVNKFWNDNANVAIEAYDGAIRRYFYWQFFRPHFNASLIWWHWFVGVTLRYRSNPKPLDFFEEWFKLMNSCTSVVVPDDFRSSLVSSGVRVDQIEYDSGVRLICNRPPIVDFSLFKKTWNANAGLASSAAHNSNDLQSGRIESGFSLANVYSVADLCGLTHRSFDEVWNAAKSIGRNNPPFDSFNANQICIYLTGTGIDVLERSSSSYSSGVVSEPAETISAPSASIYNDTRSGELPQLVPSRAEIPSGLQCIPEGIEGLKFCLANSSTAIQSFFNVLPVAGFAGNEVYLNDDSMLVQPFDELLYCQIIKENHKYALAELYDQRADVAEERGQRFRRWGILGGIFLLNPLVPFMAYAQGRASAPRGSKLEELIPDPQLQFLQDRNSFLAMTQASGVLPRLRRMIFHKVDDPSGTYYRIVPAVITQDSVIPCQVFSFNSTCFLRPVSAGIESNQGNYEARRIHRQYYHPRVGGTSIDTGERILIKGKDIDDQRFKVFQFSSDTRDLTYFYVDYPADPSHVF